MSLQKRLILGFLFVLSLVAINVVIYSWSSRARAASMESLLQAVHRQVLIASAQQRLRDLQKEMGLLSELYAQPGAGVSDADEAAKFTGQLESVRREVQEIGALSPSDAAPQARRLQEASSELLASWRVAFDSLGSDNTRAIKELSMRAEPLGQEVVQDLLPALERQEAERVERARAGSRRVAHFTDRVMLVIFAASVALGAFVAFGLSRYMVAANRALEQGVAERTTELRQEVEVRRQAEEETRRSLSLQRATLESTADGLIVVDAAGRILTWNQKFADMFRIPQPVLDSGDRRRITAYVREQSEDPEGFRRRVEELYADPDAEGFDILTLKDGRIFERYSQPHRLDGVSVGRVWSFRDVTERRQAEEALRESEERYALAAQGANDGLWDWNLKTGTIFLSARWKSMLGHEEAEIGDHLREWFGRVHPDDRDRLGVEIVAHLEGVLPHFEHEHRMRHKDGHYVWVLTRGLAERHFGEAYRMAGSQTDITLRKQAEERLVHDALHDALTGLSNRALFMDRLGSALGRRRRRSDFLFAVIFLDLDRFKVVNDGLGHLVGDQLLVGIARRLEACLRPGDTVARLGGDEFTLLLDDVKSADDAIAVAERIQSALLQPFNLAGQEVFTTASLGIALSGLGHDRPEDLLRDADTAMYRAKAMGKARYVVFDEEMRARAVSLLRLESSLRSALKRQELRVHYQPIVSLATTDVVAVEALARWQHSERGLISSQEFIAMAEETGLIVPIGEWVMREACRQVVSWDSQVPGACRVALSVNLSGRQFLQPDLVGAIQNVLSDSGLDARRLRLEITESVILDNLEAARDMLARLRALGIQIHMDDFGTGYSSMSYLRDFQIDALKIDRSFVSHLGPDPDASEIVRTIVALGQNLGLEVIAEGVETDEQVRQLRMLQCDYGQGYYFGGPLDERAARAWLAAAIAQ